MPRRFKAEELVYWKTIPRQGPYRIKKVQYKPQANPWEFRFMGGPYAVLRDEKAHLTFKVLIKNIER